MPIHFTADKKTLVSLIQPTMTAVSSRNTLPALEGLLFTLKGSELSGLRLRAGKRQFGRLRRSTACPTARSFSMRRRYLPLSVIFPTATSPSLRMTKTLFPSPAE